MIPEKTKMAAKTIGARIKIARLNKKLTAEELAEKLDVSLRTYLNLERGSTGVALGTFLNALDLLEIDLTEVVPISSKLLSKRVKRVATIKPEEVDF